MATETNSRPQTLLFSFFSELFRKRLYGGVNSSFTGSSQTSLPCNIEDFHDPKILLIFGFSEIDQYYGENALMVGNCKEML